MEKTSAIISIVFSICVIISGLYIYIVSRQLRWIKTEAKIEKVQIVKKIINNNLVSTLNVKFSFKVGSINYYSVFNNDILGINDEESKKELIKNRKMTLYYDTENPNIAYLNMPRDGITVIFFGLILLTISSLFYYSINNCTIEND